jgi:hypothetical protein
LATYRKGAVLALAGMLLIAVAAIAAEVAPGVQVHGYMQNRGYFAPGANAEFRSERISISAVATLPESSTGYVELYYHPWAPSDGLYIESAYYETGLGAGKIRVGKGRRMTFGITPSYPNRKSSNYGIVPEAFTQDRIQGVQYMVQQGTLDAGIAVHTGYRLGQRRIGEVPGDYVRNATHQVQHLAFRDDESGGGSPSRLSSKLAVSARLGGKWANGVKAGVSYYDSTLDSEDLTALTSETAATLLNTAGGTGTSLAPVGTTSKTMWIGGADFSWKQPSGFVLQGEYYSGKVSVVKDKAWTVLAGWEPPQGWKFFARYADHDLNATRTANRLSWPVKQINLSAVQPLRKALWIQYEYEMNRESPPAGTAKVKNDLFFVELFTGF